jgi:hypothetical protein
MSGVTVTCVDILISVSGRQGICSASGIPETHEDERDIAAGRFLFAQTLITGHGASRMVA